MKKLVTFICILLMSSLMVACNKTPETTNEVVVVKQDCFEFDITNQQFTENILLSVNITNEFNVNTDLLSNDPIYYIGDFKKRNEANEVIRTIQVYEYNNPNFNILQDSTKVSDNWYIANKCIEDDTHYIKTFYCNKSGYIIGIDIVNNTKEPLTVDDGLALLTFLIGEETKKPSINEEKAVTAQATLENPARLGEWISTTVYNKTSKKYEPICISIDEIYNGDIAQQIVTDYNNLNYTEFYLYEPGVFEYVIIEYSIFFPSDFTVDKNGNANIILPMSICNLRDNGKGINGELNLEQKFTDISIPMTNITPGSIWSDGKCLYEMIIDYDAYYIKIESDDKLSDTKYIQP